MTEYTTLAAVDLGSNSFHLQVARIVDDQIYPLDSHRETVRLALGLTRDKYLDDVSQQRALECLARFGERLKGLPEDAVRAVGTNTLRVAKNALAFLNKAQTALGFPIDIVAGREEARLIYLGVAHSLPITQDTQLVVDIGGGSTEMIIGNGMEPLKMTSLYMGSVTYSQRFFNAGSIQEADLLEAELAARTELQTVKSKFKASRWGRAVGSSGTARALAEILEQNGYSAAGITPQGLARLRTAMLKAGDYRKLRLAGLREDRAPILAGGFAIMAGVFSELGIKHMIPASGALREGVLYDLLGRFHHHDIRDVTVRQFMRRYHVDQLQAARVAELAARLYMQLADRRDKKFPAALQLLNWAACLHEVGISVSYS
ncbi:MAG: exopolyphosphatase, partial [Burkholderiales bacterium]